MQTEQLHAAALAQAGEVIAHVRPDDLSRPTPCAGWNLEHLLMHMVGQNHGFAAALHAASGTGPAAGLAAYAPRPVSADPGPPWCTSADAVAAAFARAPATAAVLLAEVSPDPLPRDAVQRIHLLDTVVHTWDVAVTLGRTHRPDDALVAAVLAVARRVPAGPTRTEQGAAFGAPRPAADSDEWRTALALLGRDGLIESLDSRVVSYERVIQARPQQLFALIADPSAQPRFDGNNNLATAAHGQRVRAVGDLFTMTLTGGAVRENHVVEFEEARRIAWRPAEPGRQPPGHLWRWEFVALDDAHTLIRHTYDWTELTDPQRFERARATTTTQLQASVDRLVAATGTPPQGPS